MVLRDAAQGGGVATATVEVSRKAMAPCQSEDNRGGIERHLIRLTLSGLSSPQKSEFLISSIMANSLSFLVLMEIGLELLSGYLRYKA